MNTSREAEIARVRRIYERYRASDRRRRAWDAGNPGNRAMRDELLAAVLDEARAELASAGEVLDVGSGSGFWLAALHDAGVEETRLTGVDILPRRVAAATERVPGATVRQADARALPFENDRFASVLLFTVLSSLASTQDVRLALDEAVRVLRPSGLLLVYEARLPNPLNRKTRRISHSQLRTAGIRPLDQRSLTLLPPLARRLGRATTFLYPRLARLALLRSHCLMAYRKEASD